MRYKGSVTARRKEHEATLPEGLVRGQYGSVLWPRDTLAAWRQLCALARVTEAEGLWMSVDALMERLWEHGEGTQRTTVIKISQALLSGRLTWR